MIDPATEVSQEDYEVCKNCARTRCEHHYGPDGPASAFVYTSNVLFCPGVHGVYRT